MLKIVEFGLLAVSLLTVIGLMLTAPHPANVLPQETEEGHLPPIVPR